MSSNLKTYFILLRFFFPFLSEGAVQQSGVNLSAGKSKELNKMNFCSPLASPDFFHLYCRLQSALAYVNAAQELNILMGVL